MPDFERPAGMAGLDRAVSSAPPSFLEHVDITAAQIRQRTEDISAKLSNAGFFGPPEEAAKTTSPMEDNRRSSISDELHRTERVLTIIEHQLKSLI